MAGTKTFADMKKPGRRPTPDEIAAFEETGRAARILDPQLATETRVSVSPDPRTPSAALAQKGVDTENREPAFARTREPAFAESREHVNPEIIIAASPPSREHGNAPSQNAGHAGPRIAVDVQTRKAVDTETRIAGPVVRLTIDLDEPVHTRFKTACVMTKRKMVDEVRTFIERRTAELEGETGRTL